MWASLRSDCSATLGLYSARPRISYKPFRPSLLGISIGSVQLSRCGPINFVCVAQPLKPSGNIKHQYTDQVSLNGADV